MNIEELATRIKSDAEEILRQLAQPPDPVIKKIKVGESIQNRLNEGAGVYELETGDYTGPIVLSSGQELIGNASTIRADRDRALTILPKTNNVTVRGLYLVSTHPEVLSIGENTDRQTRVEDAPSEIHFHNINIVEHRGKRGFAIHCRDSKFVNCSAKDIWDPNGSDSQAIYIGNSPGGLLFENFSGYAGSECVLIGGDKTKIPGLIPTNIVFKNLELKRPLSWQTDRVAKKVKNIFEIKNGQLITVDGFSFSGCWAQGQAGEAIMITPGIDGAVTDPPLYSGHISDITFKNGYIQYCSTMANITGRDHRTWQGLRTGGVRFENIGVTLSKAEFGGRGQLITCGGEPHSISLNNITAKVDGTSLIYYSRGNVIDELSKTLRVGGTIGELAITNCNLNLPQYGIMLDGRANMLNWQDSIEVAFIEGNAFFGNTAPMKKLFPNNTFI